MFSFFRRKKKEYNEDDYVEDFEKDDEVKEEVEKVIIEEHTCEKDENFSYNFEIDESGVNNNKEFLSNFSDFKELSAEERDKLIRSKIILVAKNHSDFQTIDKTAKIAAAAIGYDNAQYVKAYLKEKIEIPIELKPLYHDHAQWDTVIENSILSIIYAFSSSGVDELLMLLAANESNKFKLINLLSKLASRNIETDKIIDSIIYLMRDYSDSEIIKVLPYLSQIKKSTKIERLFELYFKKYIVENKIDEAYDTVRYLINSKGECTEKGWIFLKALALHNGKMNADLVIDGAEGLIDLKNIDEAIRIKAAITCYYIDRDDKDIVNKLVYLSHNSLDLEVRKYIQSVLKESQN